MGVFLLLEDMTSTEKWGRKICQQNHKVEKCKVNVFLNEVVRFDDHKESDLKDKVSFVSETTLVWVQIAFLVQIAFMLPLVWRNTTPLTYSSVSHYTIDLSNIIWWITTKIYHFKTSPRIQISKNVTI